MKCPNCQADIDDSAKFCPECGEEFNTKRFCPKCGKELPSGVNFCPECGEVVEDEDSGCLSGCVVRALDLIDFIIGIVVIGAIIGALSAIFS